MFMFTIMFVFTNTFVSTSMRAAPQQLDVSNVAHRIARVAIDGSERLYGRFCEGFAEYFVEGFAEGFTRVNARLYDSLSNYKYSRPREGGSPRRRFTLKGSSVQKV